MSASYLRCRHCRGFYELALSHCRYCAKDVPVMDAQGSPRVYPDRATCRAIQIAEFEQLPPEAHEDCMRPDPQLLDRLCYCLHCGPEGGLFEAVEMRWMPNEDKWACPCTTCGGRGFQFDIFPVERLWQCANCHHWYSPVDDDYRASNAKCPKCGCTEASGYFDDEEDDEEYEEEEFFDMEGEVELGLPVEDEDPAPWSAVEEDEYEPYEMQEREQMPDDIDFPQTRAEHLAEGDFLNEDDIPF
ncbi:MAG TPA: hypothetical protein VM008_10785 [Phycisphaerae bacterium]|nr:hypothetical protein [Phycisphaerae bacterium]